MKAPFVGWSSTLFSLRVAFFRCKGQIEFVQLTWTPSSELSVIPSEGLFSSAADSLLETSSVINLEHLQPLLRIFKRSYGQTWIDHNSFWRVGPWHKFLSWVPQAVCYYQTEGKEVKVKRISERAGLVNSKENSASKRCSCISTSLSLLEIAFESFILFKLQSTILHQKSCLRRCSRINIPRFLLIHTFEKIASGSFLQAKWMLLYSLSESLRFQLTWPNQWFYCTCS